MRRQYFSRGPQAFRNLGAGGFFEPTINGELDYEGFLRSMAVTGIPIDSSSPTSLMPTISSLGRHITQNYHHDYDCIPRDIISLKQVTDCPIDPIFDLLGEREYLIKKLHLKRPHRSTSRRNFPMNLLGQIR